MKNSVKIFGSLCVLISMSARAGHEGGNGGHSIVCRDASGAIQSAELLDVYEARILQDRHIDLGDANLSVKDKLKIALDRLARLSPKRAERFQQQAEAFLTGAKFLKGVDLEFVPDAANVAVPRGCNLEQLVIQKEPMIPGDARYTVNADLWDKLDNDNRVATILHEITYREFLSYGHMFSTSARYFVGLVVSHAIEKLTMKQFIEMAQSLAIKNTDIGGGDFQILECKMRYEPDATYRCETPADVTFKLDFDYYPSGNIKSFLSNAHLREHCLNDEISIPISPFVFRKIEGLCSTTNEGMGLRYGDTSPAQITEFFAPYIWLIGSFGQISGYLNQIGDNAKNASYELFPDGHLKYFNNGRINNSGRGYCSGNFEFDIQGNFKVTGGGCEFYQGQSVSADSVELSSSMQFVRAIGHVVSDNLRNKVSADLMFRKDDGKFRAENIHELTQTIESKNNSRTPRVLVGLDTSSWAEWTDTGLLATSGLGVRIDFYNGFGDKTVTVESPDHDTHWDENGLVTSLLPTQNVAILVSESKSPFIAQAHKEMTIKGYQGRTEVSAPIEIHYMLESFILAEAANIDSDHDGLVPCRKGERVDVVTIMSCILDRDMKFAKAHGWGKRAIAAGTRIRMNAGYIEPADSSH